MEISARMDMIESGEDLSEDRGGETGGEWTTFPRFRELIKVTLHAFEDEVEFFGGGKKESVIEGNDIWMHWNLPQ